MTILQNLLELRRILPSNSDQTQQSIRDMKLSKKVRKIPTCESLIQGICFDKLMFKLFVCRNTKHRLRTFHDLFRNNKGWIQYLKKKKLNSTTTIFNRDVTHANAPSIEFKRVRSSADHSHRDSIIMIKKQLH